MGSVANVSLMLKYTFVIQLLKLLRFNGKWITEKIYLDTFIVNCDL